MRTKIYLLLIALVTTIGSVWGQASAVQVADGNGLYYLLDTPVAGEATVGYNPAFTSTNWIRFGGVETAASIANGYASGIPPFNSVANTYSSSSATIPTTITHSGDAYRVTAIGDWAFAGSALTSIIIPEGIEKLGIYSFAFSVDLEVLGIPTTLTILEHNVFRGCLKLGTITMPEDGTTFRVRDNVLLDGNILAVYPPGRTDTEYTLPNNIVLANNKGYSAFVYATNLKNVNLHDGITSIPPAAFSYCLSLESMIIPNGVTAIGAYAFQNVGLTSLEIPESVKNIESSAFAATPLQSVNILSSDIILSNSVFRNCEYLETITLLGETPPRLQGDVFGGITDVNNITLHIPKGSSENYDITPWNGFKATLDDFYIIVYKNEGKTYLTETYPITSEYITEPITPTRAGYTFDGWYNNGVKWNFSQLVTASMTLTAEWNEIIPPTQYTVTIEPLAGVTVNKPEGGTVDEGRPFSFTATPDAGYTVTVYVNRTEHAPTSDNFYLIEGIEEDITITFTLTAGTYNEDSIVGGITINGEPLDDSKTDFPETGVIVITFNDDANTNVTGKVIIDGKEVPGTWGTDSNGNPTYTIDYAVTGDGEHTIKIEGFGGDGETHTFTTGGGSGNNGNNGNNGDGGKVVIDDTTPPVLPGDYPGNGEIVVYPPVVTFPEIPEVTINGEKVVPGGRWEDDENGAPVIVIEYEDLEDGEHTIVVNGKEYTFTVKNGGATSNTILSTTKVVAGNGTISVSVAQPTLVQIVSISGAVVYSANVASETVVSLAQGLYIVKAGASGVKVVVR